VSRPAPDAGAYDRDMPSLQSSTEIAAHSPSATISRRAALRLDAGHVWVYRSDITRLAPEAPPAGLMQVLDPAGRLIGTALWSPASQIALRLLAREALDAQSWSAALASRLDAAISRREAMLTDNGTDSCRLVFSEADALPGIVIDKYAGLAVLQLLAAGVDSDAVRAAVVAALTRNFAAGDQGLQTILERPDPRIRELEALAAPDATPLWTAAADPAEAQRKTEFHLNDLKFLYDADAGQKTGAFLDQRQNYRLAAQYGHGDALDMCCYQGGFALHLATTCRSVTGLDTSAAALAVAEQNMSLNQGALGSIPIEWVQGDAFQAMRDWSDAGEEYDTIVLDPPAFAKSQRAAENAMRGYKELNLRAFKMLRPGGTLVTCSCSHHVSLQDFQAVVAAAAGDAGRRVRLTERTGAAPDHPVVLTIPETEYLKCLVLEVE
jgi:23S rRNA (cytosine1962-C5)-methyltransferase